MESSDSECELHPEQLRAYLGGGLDPAGRAYVAAHLARCAQCQARLAASAQLGGALTCQELVELVTDYFEGRLDPDERARFEGHLAGCAGCRAYLVQMRQTIRLVGSLSEALIEPPARDALLRLFQGWKRGAVGEQPP